MSNSSSFSNNTDYHDNTVKEAQPKFRSVNVAMPNRTADLHLAKSQQGPMYRQPPTLYKRYDSQSTSMKPNKPKARWIVRKGKAIPFFGLVSGSVEIFCNVATVASRIDDSLRKRSVQVKFDSENAEASCRTRNFVDFRICLYASDDGASTHVELIRIHGCGFAFRSEYDAIIQAAKGSGGRAMPMPPKIMTIPESLMKLYKPPSTNELQETIDRACEQFHSKNRYDVSYALQNLASVSNPEKVNTQAANAMSDLIMSNASNVRDLILTIYAARCDYPRDNVSDLICHSCLSVMLNGIKCKSSEKGHCFLDETYEQFAGKLIPHLIQDVKECGSKRSSSCNACLALECLRLMLKNSSLACQSVEEFNVRDIVSRAEEYGSREYFNLEQIAKSTIELLVVN